jgi:hypothetical protein
MPNAADCATLQALAEGVAAARRDVELEWGAERLPLLIGDEWRIKLRRQLTKWSAELQEAWDTGHLTAPQLDQLRTTAAAVQRMWPKLGEIAAEAGHRPVHPDVWEIPLADGSVMALVRSNDEAAAVTASGRHLRVLTAAEIANVWDALPGALQVVKVEFPGARFVGGGDRGWVKDGDPIPFGDERK